MIRDGRAMIRDGRAIPRPRLTARALIRRKNREGKTWSVHVQQHLIHSLATCMSGSHHPACTHYLNGKMASLGDVSLIKVNRMYMFPLYWLLIPTCKNFCYATKLLTGDFCPLTNNSNPF